MSTEKYETVLVVGTGTMGAGIAQVAAAAGHSVLLYDAIPSAAERALNNISDSLKRAEGKGHVTPEQREATIANLHPVEAITAAADATLIVEAVKEEQSIKQRIFADLEKLVGPRIPIWSNTSMIPISTLGTSLAHPERFCGVHFFNPVPRMRLVEIIAGTQTAAATVEHAASTVARWGKTPVFAPDSPGFIVNRIFDALKREALALLDQGVRPDQIDTAVRLGLNFPMGPFELMDLIGLDTTLDCLINQAKSMGRPASFGERLPALVASGKTGRKSGEGFYRYENQPSA